MRLLTWLFDYKLKPERVLKGFNRCCEETRREFHCPADNGVIVSCVQHEIKPVHTVYRYIKGLDSFVRQAAEQHSCLIVFPEYNFFDMLGFIPGYALINAMLHKAALRKKVSQPSAAGSKHSDQSGENEGKPAGFGVVFAAVAAPIERASRQIMSFLAAQYGVSIYSGSYIISENGRLYNAGYLYGPDGKCLGTQKKLHLTQEEYKMGLCSGNELQVFDLPFGKTAFPICMDATYFETFCIAVEQGAEIVAIPISNNEEYFQWRALRGIWTRVQESTVYGLKASQNGWVAGMHFTGISGIFVPLSMTSDGTGVLAAAPEPEGDALISCSLDMRKLRQARESAMYCGDSNPVFEKDYVERTYGLLKT